MWDEEAALMLRMLVEVALTTLVVVAGVVSRTLLLVEVALTTLLLVVDLTMVVVLLDGAGKLVLAELVVTLIKVVEDEVSIGAAEELELSVEEGITESEDFVLRWWW